MKVNKSVGRKFSKLDIIFITVSVISLIFMLLDRQNAIIYAEVIQFSAILFFITKGIHFARIKNAKYATQCFLFSVIFIGAEILKLLMYNNTF